jgi:murein DD-endopeptidase MepM/ murein hydrolase activator NlpD
MKAPAFMSRPAVYPLTNYQPPARGLQVKRDKSGSGKSTLPGFGFIGQNYQDNYQRKPLFDFLSLYANTKKLLKPLGASLPRRDAGKKPFSRTEVNVLLNSPPDARPESPAGRVSREPVKKSRSVKSAGKPALPSAFSVLGISGIGALLLTIIVFFNPQVYSFSWLSRDAYFVEPLEDNLGQFSLAIYAGLGPETSVEDAETIPLDLTETFKWIIYTVKKGDSVSRIAARNAISMDAIIASNGIANARRLREGETLRIPNMDGIPYTVKHGDSLIKISAASGVPLEAILDANDIQSDAINPGTMLFLPGARMKKEDLKLALGEGLFVYPVQGRLTSTFGWRQDPINKERRFHSAIDLAAPQGTTVKAAVDGRVSLVGLNSVYGKYIILSHSNGFQTMYAHLSATSVKQGERVEQGAKIGEVGSTGYSTGPHLHFALFKNGRPVNPLDFLNP